MEAKQNQNHNILGENLKQLLDSKRLNITQAALELNLPIMTIRRLLSGETADPRLSTLTVITNYFKISIDRLTAGIQPMFHSQQTHHKPQFIPILDWETAANIKSVNDLNLNEWQHWQSISDNKQDTLSENAFALESRPALYSRFPKGALFIIDPDIIPIDGDIVLVKINNNELTLREIYIDPPEKRLHSLVPGSGTLIYSEQTHNIIGVNILTMLYNRNS